MEFVFCEELFEGVNVHVLESAESWYPESQAEHTALRSYEVLVTAAQFAIDETIHWVLSTVIIYPVWHFKQVKEVVLTVDC